MNRSRTHEELVCLSEAEGVGGAQQLFGVLGQVNLHAQRLFNGAFILSLSEAYV